MYFICDLFKELIRYLLIDDLKNFALTCKSALGVFKNNISIVYQTYGINDSNTGYPIPNIKYFYMKRYERFNKYIFKLISNVNYIPVFKHFIMSEKNTLSYMHCPNFYPTCLGLEYKLIVMAALVWEGKRFLLCCFKNYYSILDRLKDVIHELNIEYTIGFNYIKLKNDSVIYKVNNFHGNESKYHSIVFLDVYCRGEDDILNRFKEKGLKHVMFLDYEQTAIEKEIKGMELTQLDEFERKDGMTCYFYNSV